MKTVFYTALYGNNETIKEFDTGGFPFYCFTDNKAFARSKTWDVVLWPSSDPPRLAAKRHKLDTALVGERAKLEDGDLLIWIDASITVTNPQRFVDACTEALNGHRTRKHPIAFFKHPERENIVDEANASLKMSKYAFMPLDAQIRAYRKEGIPLKHGLYAGGVIARRYGETAAFDAAWLKENVDRTLQDQISLPYVLWKLGVKPGVIPGSVYGTDFHSRVWTGESDQPVHPPRIVSADHTIEPAGPLKLSVITPTHDPKWLGEAWESLRTQTHSDFEWLISVNDKSGRRTAVRMRANEVHAIVGTDPRIKVVEDLSPFSHVGARKAFAFGAASGDGLIEFDHDDLLVPTALEEIAAAFADPEVGFVYSDFADFVQGAPDLQGNLTYRHPEIRPGWAISGITFYDQDIVGVRPGRYDCVSAPPPTALMVSHIYTAPNHVRVWRRSVYEALGGHDPERAIADDHELVVRSYLATHFHHIAKPLYLYRITGENTWARNVGDIKTASDQIQNDYLERLVLRECELLGVPAVELGGGIDPRAGWTACDLENAPIIADLRQRWPFGDGSIGAFRASDILEHLPDKMHTMNEIHRCLRPGGWLISMTPSSEGWGADADPTHHSRWNPMSFWYYTRDASARYIRSKALFREVHLDTVPIYIQGVNVPYVRANLVKL